MGNFVEVCKVGDLAPGRAKVVRADRQKVALCNVNGKFYATGNTCPHQGASLGEGLMAGNSIICPWHGWTFDVRDGSSPVQPAVKIPCYETRVEGSSVMVRIQ